MKDSDFRKAYDEAIERQAAGSPTDEDLRLIKHAEREGKVAEWAGNSSAPSTRNSEKQTDEDETNHRSPAQTTGNRSAKGKTDSSTVEQTGGRGRQADGDDAR